MRPYGAEARPHAEGLVETRGTDVQHSAASAFWRTFDATRTAYFTSAGCDPIHLMALFLRINNRRCVARSEQTHLAFYGSKGQKSSVYWTFELLGLHEFLDPQGGNGAPR